MRVTIDTDELKNLMLELSSDPHGDSRLLAILGESRFELVPSLTYELQKSVPTGITWRPESDTFDADTASQRILFAGLLSVWKFLRFSESLADSWGPGAEGFKALSACGASRSAMEEAARMAAAGEQLWTAYFDESHGLIPDAHAITQDLLNSGESLGLVADNAFAGETSGWRGIFSLVQGASKLRRAGIWCPNRSVDRSDDAGHIYGVLSTIVHPKGPGREMFRIKGFEGGYERLTLNPSKASLTRVRAASICGWSYALDLTLSAWGRFIRVAALLEETVAPDTRAEDLVAIEFNNAVGNGHMFANWTPLPRLAIE